MELSRADSFGPDAVGLFASSTDESSTLLSARSESSSSSLRGLPRSSASVLSSAPLLWDGGGRLSGRSKASAVLGVGFSEMLADREQQRQRVRKMVDEGVSPETLPLRTILKSSEQLAPFLLFAESHHSADAVFFFLRVEEYRQLVERYALASVAANIWQNFFSDASERQISLSAHAVAHVREKLDSGEPLENTLFDPLQREAYQLIALSVYPSYLAFLRQSPSARGPVRDEPAAEAIADEDSESELSFSGSKRSDDADEKGKEEMVRHRPLYRENSLPDDVQGLFIDTPQPVRPRPVRSSDAVSDKMRACVGGVETRDFAAVLKSTQQWEAFVAYCEHVHAAELPHLYIRATEFLAAQGDPLVSAQIASSIAMTFLAEGAPQRVQAADSALLRQVRVAIAKQSDEKEAVLSALFERLLHETASLMRLRLYPDYCSFAAKKGLARAEGEGRHGAEPMGIPSLRECLERDYVRFFHFAKEAQCEELLLFWRQVSAFEHVPFDGYVAMHAAAEEIYAQFLSPLSLQEVNVDLRVGAKLVLYSLQHKLVDRDLFRLAKKEAEMVILQDLWPRFVHSEQPQLDKAARSAAPPRPDVAAIVAVIQKAALQSRLRRGKGRADFAAHPFWTQRKRRLRVVRCSARTSREVKPDDLAELRLVHGLKEGDFRVMLRSVANETVLKSGCVTAIECLTVLSAFCALGDFVVVFTPIRRKRSVQVEDHLLGGSETVYVDSSYSSDADVTTTELDEGDDNPYVRGYRSD